MRNEISTSISVKAVQCVRFLDCAKRNVMFQNAGNRPAAACLAAMILKQQLHFQMRKPGIGLKPKLL